VENLALCKFSVIGGVQLQHVSKWLKDICGWDLSIQDLIEVGERSFKSEAEAERGMGDKPQK